ncbi:MAG: response regulator [Methylococcales bacterium]|nr:response regulator [Methylococcales bacterium]
MKLDFRKQRFLLADAVAQRRKTLRNILYTLSAENISEVSSGAAALTQIQNHLYDFVLCSDDLGKGKNGQQVLEEARLRGYLPLHTIFVMVSAEQSQDKVLGILENKPDDYLTYPFNAKQLAQRLERHFQRKQTCLTINQAIAAGDMRRAIKICEAKLNTSPPDIARYLKRLLAELALKTDDLGRAEALYRAFLKQRELDWVWLGLGKVALQKKQFNQAEACFHKALAIQPRLLECYDGLAECQQARANLAGAQNMLATALKLSPSVLARQQKQAQIALANNDLETAEQAAKMSLKLSEHSMHRQAGDFKTLAQIQQKQGLTEEALQSLQKLRRSFPKQHEAILSAALLEIELFKTMDNTLLAEEAYQEALREYGKLDPPIPGELAIDLARRSMQEQNYAAAQAILEDVAKHYPDHSDLMSTVAQLPADFGQHQLGHDAIARARRVLIEANNEGVTLFKQQRYREAETQLRRAFGRLPRNQTLLVNLLKVMIHNLESLEYDERKLANAFKYLDIARDLNVATDVLNALNQRLQALEEQHHLSS